MDTLGNEAIREFENKKTDNKSACRFPTNAKGKQIENTSFHVPRKVENNRDILQDSASKEIVPVDSQETGKNPATNELPSENKENDLPNSDTNYVPFSDYTNITIPLIGKNVFQIDEKPFSECYDLAAERNKRRSAHSKTTDFDSESLNERKASISESDKKKNAITRKNKDINMACYLSELCSKILKELKGNEIREKKLACHLRKFLLAPVTPTCLLYLPHLIHTISFIRGNKAFSKILRLTANECYDKCHVMFPIPPGYNFETVYTSEMQKFLPDDFEKFEGKQFNYGDIDDLLEKCDSCVYNNLITALYYNPNAR